MAPDISRFAEHPSLLRCGRCVRQEISFSDTPLSEIEVIFR